MVRFLDANIFQREEAIIGNRLLCLFYCLNHHFDTSDNSPDSHDKTSLVDMEHVECEHEKTADNNEDGLTYTCIHCLYMHISSVIYLFYKKDKWCQKARCCEKYANSHEGKRHLEIIERIHIKKEQSYWRSTREKYEKQDEEVWLQWHDLTKIGI